MFVLLEQISKLRRFTHTEVDTLKVPVRLMDVIDVTVRSVRKGRQRGI